MFARCLSLSSLPDISKWNVKNVQEMEYIFMGCFSLLSLPNISMWSIKNIVLLTNSRFSLLTYMPIEC